MGKWKMEKRKRPEENMTSVVCQPPRRHGEDMENGGEPTNYGGSKARDNKNQLRTKTNK